MPFFALLSQEGLVLARLTEAFVQRVFAQGKGRWEESAAGSSEPQQVYRITESMKFVQDTSYVPVLYLYEGYVLVEDHAV